MRAISLLTIIVLTCFASFVRARAQPTTQPADISPAAQTLLGQMREAYSKVQSLELIGTYTLDIEAAGETTNKSAQFTSGFVAPNKLWHGMKDDATILGNGESVVMYLPQRNGYLTLPGIAARGAELPEQIGALLQEQNPSLQVALAADGPSALLAGATAVFVENNGDLVIERADRKVRVMINHQTKFMLAVSIDLRNVLTAGGVPDVKRAYANIIYTSVKVDQPIDAARFVWTPPLGAKQLKPDAPELAGATPEELTVGDDDSSSAMKLVGKPAPAFTLNDRDGKAVTLAALKGNVVVLDFWATWCPPCRASLPHLDALSTNVVTAGENVRIFAVNLREDREKVAAFMKEKSLTLPVLFDENGDVAKKFNVTGIPQTVVIGPDGLIRNVFIGYGPGDEIKLAEAVRLAHGDAAASQPAPAR